MKGRQPPKTDDRARQLFSELSMAIEEGNQEIIERINSSLLNMPSDFIRSNHYELLTKQFFIALSEVKDASHLAINILLLLLKDIESNPIKTMDQYTIIKDFASNLLAFIDDKHLANAFIILHEKAQAYDKVTLLFFIQHLLLTDKSSQSAGVFNLNLFETLYVNILNRGHRQLYHQSLFQLLNTDDQLNDLIYNIAIGNDFELYKIYKKHCSVTEFTAKEIANIINLTTHEVILTDLLKFHQGKLMEIILQLSGAKKIDWVLSQLRLLQADGSIILAEDFYQQLFQQAFDHYLTENKYLNLIKSLVTEPDFAIELSTAHIQLLKDHHKLDNLPPFAHPAIDLTQYPPYLEPYKRYSEEDGLAYEGLVTAINDNNQEKITALLTNYRFATADQKIGYLFLYKAYRDKNKALFTLLLQHQADPNAWDPDGDLHPLLHKTVIDHEYPYFYLLMEYGAKHDLVDNYGNQALAYSKIKPGIVIDGSLDKEPRYFNTIKFRMANYLITNAGASTLISLHRSYSKITTNFFQMLLIENDYAWLDRFSNLITAEHLNQMMEGLNLPNIYLLMLLEHHDLVKKLIPDDYAKHLPTITRGSKLFLMECINYIAMQDQVGKDFTNIISKNLPILLDRLGRDYLQGIDADGKQNLDFSSLFDNLIKKWKDFSIWLKENPSIAKDNNDYLNKFTTLECMFLYCVKHNITSNTLQNKTSPAYLDTSAYPNITNLALIQLLSLNYFKLFINALDTIDLKTLHLDDYRFILNYPGLTDSKVCIPSFKEKIIETLYLQGNKNFILSLLCKTDNIDLIDTVIKLKLLENNINHKLLVETAKKAYLNNPKCVFYEKLLANPFFKEHLADDSLYELLKRGKLELLNPLAQLPPRIISYKDQQGNTLLHVAASLNNPQVFQKILNLLETTNTLDLNLKNENGQTVLDILQLDQKANRRSIDSIKARQTPPVALPKAHKRSAPIQPTNVKRPALIPSPTFYQTAALAQPRAKNIKAELPVEDLTAKKYKKTNRSAWTADLDKKEVAGYLDAAKENHQKFIEQAKMVDKKPLDKVPVANFKLNFVEIPALNLPIDANDHTINDVKLIVNDGMIIGCSIINRQAIIDQDGEGDYTNDLIQQFDKQAEVISRNNETGVGIKHITDSKNQASVVFKVHASEQKAEVKSQAVVKEIKIKELQRLFGFVLPCKLHGSLVTLDQEGKPLSQEQITIASDAHIFSHYDPDHTFLSRSSKHAKDQFPIKLYTEAKNTELKDKKHPKKKPYLPEQEEPEAEIEGAAADPVADGLPPTPELPRSTQPPVVLTPPPSVVTVSLLKTTKTSASAQSTKEKRELPDIGEKGHKQKKHRRGRRH